MYTDEQIRELRTRMGPSDVKMMITKEARYGPRLRPAHHETVIFAQISRKQHAMYKKLGGVRWLRLQLDRAERGLLPVLMPAKYGRQTG